MLRMQAWALLLVVSAPAILLQACGFESEMTRSPIEATVVRDGYYLKGEIVTRTTALFLEPIGDYEGICDKVLQIGYEEGVLAPESRVADELPLVIDGDRWTAEYFAERKGIYVAHVVGEGEIHKDRISGRYEGSRFDKNGRKTFRYEVRFETSE